MRATLEYTTFAHKQVQRGPVCPLCYCLYSSFINPSDSARLNAIAIAIKAVIPA